MLLVESRTSRPAEGEPLGDSKVVNRLDHLKIIANFDIRRSGVD